MSMVTFEGVLEQIKTLAVRVQRWPEKPDTGVSPWIFTLMIWNSPDHDSGKYSMSVDFQADKMASAINPLRLYRPPVYHITPCVDVSKRHEYYDYLTFTRKHFSEETTLVSVLTSLRDALEEYLKVLEIEEEDRRQQEKKRIAKEIASCRATGGHVCRHCGHSL